MLAKKNYIVHLDSKKRLTLRGPAYQYYDVKEYHNGCIVLEPRLLTIPDSISAKTLDIMDESIQNFKINNVSAPIDLSNL